MLITKEMIKKAMWMSEVVGKPIPANEYNITIDVLLSFLSCLAAAAQHLNSDTTETETFRYISTSIIVLSAKVKDGTIQIDDLDELQSRTSLLPAAWQKLCTVWGVTNRDLQELDLIFHSPVFNRILGDDVLSLIVASS
jgi:hypothetical protein